MFFFESFSGIEQRNLENKRKITGIVVKTTFNGSGGTRSKQHFWIKSKNIPIFRIITEVSVTTAKN